MAHEIRNSLDFEENYVVMRRCLLRGQISLQAARDWMRLRRQQAIDNEEQSRKEFRNKVWSKVRKRPTDIEYWNIEEGEIQ